MNGVFAVNKPSGPSSAGVVDQLKEYFSASPVFADDIKQAKGGFKGKKRKYKGKPKIKIGHGGTLDPLAQGVMVIGIGNGTKQLQNYLGSCSKSYRATALFGVATTTYDSEGSVIFRSSTDHLTDELVAQTLDKFRGEISQIPPAFSALKMDGRPLYEYARNGEPLPNAIEARQCKIDSLEAGKLTNEHSYKAPETLATPEERKFAYMVENGITKANEKDHEDDILKAQEQAVVDVGTNAGPTLEIEFTVSSGTYIRTLIHDIGRALGTHATMVKLVRESQGPWSLDKNTFEVTDFTDRDSSKWEPELRHYLENGPETSLQDLRAKSVTDANE